MADFSGYDEAAAKASMAEERRRFEETPKERGPSLWALVMSADIIQWDNNLFKTSREEGLQFELDGVAVVRVSERTAFRAFDSRVAALWTVSLAADEALVIADDAGTARLLLAFEREDEAVRFASLLAADGTPATPANTPISAIKQMCAAGDALIGLVPAGTLVTPGQFKTQL